MKKCWYIFLIATVTSMTKLSAMAPTHDVVMQEAEPTLQDNHTSRPPISSSRRCHQNHDAHPCLGCAKRQRISVRSFLRNRSHRLPAQTATE